MPTRGQALDDLERLAAASIAGMTAAIRRVTRAAASRDPVLLARATERLGFEVADMVTLANLTGRGRTIEAARAAAGEVLDLGLLPVEGAVIPLPSRGLPESAKALLRRKPVLVQEAGQVAAAVEQGAFAIARDSTQEVVERVHKAIADSLARGEETPTTSAIMAETENWSRSYAETVVRTNQNRAYSEGADEMARNPAIRSVTPAFRFDATRDTHTRPNHMAANGFIAAVDDPEWDRISPPLGFR